MLMNKVIFDALLSSGKGEGMTKSGLAIFGDAATFIAVLSIAEARNESIEAEADPRLR